MIYFGSQEGVVVLVLEPANLKYIQEGQPLLTPDQKVIIAYTPDPLWMQSEIEKVAASESKQLTTQMLNKILTEGLKRPVVMRTDPPPPSKPRVNPTRAFPRKGKAN